MSFTGIYQFGSITTKNGQTIKLEDFDKDGDGKISQQEYIFIQRELGMDTLELSEGGQKGEKQVTDEEYVTWALELQTDNVLNQLIAQVAIDFIGINSIYSSEVVNELREFTADFKSQLDVTAEGTVELAGNFEEILLNKYEEIKDRILGSDKDYEKIQQEWEKQAEDFEKNIKNAKSITEFVKLNREYIKAHGEYIQKMMASKDLDIETRKNFIEEGKADIEKSKQFSNLMSDGINMQAATDTFIKNLQEKCPDWKDLEENPIIANPDLYMLEFSQTFKPSIIEPSMSNAYREHLNIEFEKLVSEYEKLPQNKNQSSK